MLRTPDGHHGTLFQFKNPMGYVSFFCTAFKNAEKKVIVILKPLMLFLFEFLRQKKNYARLRFPLFHSQLQ